MDFNEEILAYLSNLTLENLTGNFNEQILKSLALIRAGAGNYPIVLAKGYTTKTITNTNAETSVVPSIKGSLVISANYLTAGKILRITAFNKLSTSSGQTATLKVKLGSTELVTTTETLPNGLNDEGVQTNILLTCLTSGTSGTIQADGFNLIHTGTGIVQSALRHYDNLATFNTTQEATLDITYKFSVASTSNTLKINHFLVEAI